MPDIDFNEFTNISWTAREIQGLEISIGFQPRLVGMMAHFQVENPTWTMRSVNIGCFMERHLDYGETENLNRIHPPGIKPYSGGKIAHSRTTVEAHPWTAMQRSVIVDMDLNQELPARVGVYVQIDNHVVNPMGFVLFYRSDTVELIPQAWDPWDPSVPFLVRTDLQEE